MKTIFLLMVLLMNATIMVNAQKNKAQDLKAWSADSLLTWDDFKGKPLKSSGHAAVTGSGIDMVVRSEGDVLVVRIRAVIDRDKSWVQEDQKLDHALNHEQMHFNIAEIFVRKFRKDLQTKAEKNKVGNINDLLLKLREKHFEDCGKFQEKYDAETSHGLNITKQKEWNDAILAQLEELKAYSSQEVLIR